MDMAVLLLLFSACCVACFRFPSRILQFAGLLISCLPPACAQLIGEEISNSVNFLEAGLSLVVNLSAFVTAVARGRLEHDVGMRDFTVHFGNPWYKRGTLIYSTGGRFGAIEEMLAIGHSARLRLVTPFFRFLQSLHGVHCCYVCALPATEAFDTSQRLKWGHLADCSCLVMGLQESLFIHLAGEEGALVQMLSKDQMLIVSATCAEYIGALQTDDWTCDAVHEIIRSGYPLALKALQEQSLQDFLSCHNLRVSEELFSFIMNEAKVKMFNGMFWFAGEVTLQGGQRLTVNLESITEEKLNDIDPNWGPAVRDIFKQKRRKAITEEHLQQVPIPNYQYKDLIYSLADKAWKTNLAEGTDVVTIVTVGETAAMLTKIISESLSTKDEYERGVEHILVKRLENRRTHGIRLQMQGFWKCDLRGVTLLTVTTLVLQYVIVIGVKLDPLSASLLTRRLVRNYVSCKTTVYYSLSWLVPKLFAIPLDEGLFLFEICDDVNALKYLKLARLILGLSDCLSLPVWSLLIFFQEQTLQFTSLYRSPPSRWRWILAFSGFGVIVAADLLGTIVWKAGDHFKRDANKRLLMGLLSFVIVTVYISSLICWVKSLMVYRTLFIMLSFTTYMQWLLGVMHVGNDIGWEKEGMQAISTLIHAATFLQLALLSALGGKWR